MKDIYKRRLFEIADMEDVTEKRIALIDYVDELMSMEYKEGVRVGEANTRTRLFDAICNSLSSV